MMTTTSAITIEHDGVFVTASGMIKIAATPGKYWRMWIYDEVADVWRIQCEIFKKREQAASAAALADRRFITRKVG